MYPLRYNFKILKPIRKCHLDGLSAYLNGLFEKSQLTVVGLMSEDEKLEFDTTGYTQGVGKDAWYDAYFSVAVSGRAPTDALFAVIVQRFNDVTDDVYVIGDPGSGALDQQS